MDDPIHHHEHSGPSEAFQPSDPELVALNREVLAIRDTLRAACLRHGVEVSAIFLCDYFENVTPSPASPSEPQPGENDVYPPNLGSRCTHGDTPSTPETAPERARPYVLHVSNGDEKPDDDLFTWEQMDPVCLAIARAQAALLKLNFSLYHWQRKHPLEVERMEEDDIAGETEVIYDMDPIPDLFIQPPQHSPSDARPCSGVVELKSAPSSSPVKLSQLREGVDAAASSNVNSTPDNTDSGGTVTKDVAIETEAIESGKQNTSNPLTQRVSGLQTGVMTNLLPQAAVQKPSDDASTPTGPESADETAKGKSGKAVGGSSPRTSAPHDDAVHLSAPTDNCFSPSANLALAGNKPAPKESTTDAEDGLVRSKQTVAPVDSPPSDPQSQKQLPCSTKPSGSRASPVAPQVSESGTGSPSLLPSPLPVSRCSPDTASDAPSGAHGPVSGAPSPPSTTAAAPVVSDRSAPLVGVVPSDCPDADEPLPNRTATTPTASSPSNAVVVPVGSDRSAPVVGGLPSNSSRPTEPPPGPAATTPSATCSSKAAAIVPGSSEAPDGETQDNANGEAINEPALLQASGDAPVTLASADERELRGPAVCTMNSEQERSGEVGVNGCSESLRDTPKVHLDSAAGPAPETLRPSACVNAESMESGGQNASNTSVQKPRPPLSKSGTTGLVTPSPSVIARRSAADSSSEDSSTPSITPAPATIWAEAPIDAVHRAIPAQSTPETSEPTQAIATRPSEDLLRYVDICPGGSRKYAGCTVSPVFWTVEELVEISDAPYFVRAVTGMFVRVRFGLSAGPAGRKLCTIGKAIIASPVYSFEDCDDLPRSMQRKRSCIYVRLMQGRTPISNGLGAQRIGNEYGFYRLTSILSKAPTRHDFLKYSEALAQNGESLLSKIGLSALVRRGLCFRTEPAGAIPEDRAWSVLLRDVLSGKGTREPIHDDPGAISRKGPRSGSADGDRSGTIGESGDIGFQQPTPNEDESRTIRESIDNVIQQPTLNAGSNQALPPKLAGDSSIGDALDDGSVAHRRPLGDDPGIISRTGSDTGSASGHQAKTFDESGRITSQQPAPVLASSQALPSKVSGGNSVLDTADDVSAAVRSSSLTFGHFGAQEISTGASCPGVSGVVEAVASSTPNQNRQASSKSVATHPDGSLSSRLQHVSAITSAKSDGLEASRAGVENSRGSPPTGSATSRDATAAIQEPIRSQPPSELGTKQISQGLTVGEEESGQCETPSSAKVTVAERSADRDAETSEPGASTVQPLAAEVEDTNTTSGPPTLDGRSPHKGSGSATLDTGVTGAVIKDGTLPVVTPSRATSDPSTTAGGLSTSPRTRLLPISVAGHEEGGGSENQTRAPPRDNGGTTASVGKQKRESDFKVLDIVDEVESDEAIREIIRNTPILTPPPGVTTGPTASVNQSEDIVDLTQDDDDNGADSLDVIEVFDVDAETGEVELRALRGPSYL